MRDNELFNKFRKMVVRIWIYAYVVVGNLGNVRRLLKSEVGSSSAQVPVNHLRMIDSSNVNTGIKERVYF